MKKPDLSIVILNYNTSGLLKNCLTAIEKLEDELYFEVIVVDNGSSDNSVGMTRNDYKWVKLIEAGENLGFAKGNNKARNSVSSEHVLFLNSDVIVPKKTLKSSLVYFKKNNLGALSCKLILPNGVLDKDTRRSFITPWIGLVHLFLKLDDIFPRSKLFAKYWYGYISENETHDVDSIQGAFFLTSKKILNKVGWFDEDYFLDGEDIDLCWRINKLGYRIIYYPEVTAIHLKGATKGKNKNIQGVNFSSKLKYRLTGVNSMEIFYRKHLWEKYPVYVNYLVILGIKLIKFLRLINLILFK